MNDATETMTAAVERRYARAAAEAAAGKDASCCGAGCGCEDPITSDLYRAEELTGLPQKAVAASLGCGNPTALAELHPGETVLDLGSGGGIDVLLSARRVGPTGKVYGLDMTEAMLELARANQQAAGVENAEFLHGHIEDIPLPDASVDVIISNCVINLSGDKPKVLAEAFRILKPGGRLAFSDVVTRGAIPAEVRESMTLWTSCVGGALDQDEFRDLLAETGFTAIDMEATRVYTKEDAGALLACADGVDPGLAEHLDGSIVSAFIRAQKPVG